MRWKEEILSTALAEALRHLQQGIVVVHPTGGEKVLFALDEENGMLLMMGVEHGSEQDGPNGSLIEVVDDVAPPLGVDKRLLH